MDLVDPYCLTDISLHSAVKDCSEPCRQLFQERPCSEGVIKLVSQNPPTYSSKLASRMKRRVRTLSVSYIYLD